MKNYKKLLLLFFLPLLFLAVYGYYSPDPATVAVLNKAVNNVDYKTGEEGWTEAKAGLTLKDKDVIRTGKRSLALVSFLDGSILRLRADAEMTIYGNKEDKKLDKNVYVDKGLVNFDVKKQDNEEFKFTTPTMVASIRGTGGILEVNETGTLLALISGLVDVESLVGAKQSGTLNLGNTVVVNSDGTLTFTRNSDEVLKKIEKSGNVKTKILRLNTKDQGVIEIEYLDEE